MTKYSPLIPSLRFNFPLTSTYQLAVLRAVQQEGRHAERSAQLVTVRNSRRLDFPENWGILRKLHF